MFEHFTAMDVLLREVEQDIEHGLLNKTAIHPDQVAMIHSAYRPSAQELAEARALLSVEAPAVFGQNGSMCEPATTLPLGADHSRARAGARHFRRGSGARGAVA